MAAPPDAGTGTNRGITKAGDITHVGDLMPIRQSGANNQAVGPQLDITHVGDATAAPGQTARPLGFSASNEGFDGFSSKRPVKDF